MVLETLKDVKKIGKFEITRGVSNFGSERPVFIHEETSQLSFQIQNGPVKENGINGCQIDTLIETAKKILEGLNSDFPCCENEIAIIKLDECLMWLEKRTKDREARKVEGFNKA